MIKVKELEIYCKKMLLDFKIATNTIKIDDKIYEIVDSDRILFDEDFNWLILTKNDVYGFIYQFCGHWFIQVGKEVTMQPLKYLGKPKQKIPTNNFLGIHSGNELLNGVGLYKDWIQKAKFLGVKSLGICEKNNIGGSMEFQNECLKNDIKPIFGISLEIKRKDFLYEVKCYAKNFIGWQNILKFSYKINVENQPNIDEEFLINNNQGIYIIIDPKSSKFIDYSSVTNLYQLDTVIFEEEEKDIEYIQQIKLFIKSKMKPILLCDAYYIEQDEWKVREKLWGIAKSYDYRTKNQYFKSNDEFASELIRMFVKGNTSWIKLFKDAQKNLNDICNSCNFKYDTSSRHLPKYVMTQEESKQFSSNEQLFLHLIKKGFNEKKIKNPQKYIERLRKEINVLKSGDVIDYFLVLYDIINFAKDKNILVGIGRGSAGGSLVSYLLGIIQIDPIEFDLLFERFLNNGRMGSVTECDAYLIETNSKSIKLNEKSILKILRNGKELNIFVEELLQGDKIIKY